MAPYRKHQKVKKQDTDGLLHQNDAMTSAPNIIQQLYYSALVMASSSISVYIHRRFYFLFLSDQQRISSDRPTKQEPSIKTAKKGKEKSFAS